MVPTRIYQLTQTVVLRNSKSTVSVAQNAFPFLVNVRGAAGAPPTKAGGKGGKGGAGQSVGKAKRVSNDWRD